MGEPPEKILGAKNMQNLAPFWSTSKFGGEYLWNRWRYMKSDYEVLYSDFSHAEWKKFGELWSNNHGDQVVRSYPPETIFSEDHISAPRGAAPQIFTCAREWPSLTSAFPTGDGGPPYNVFRRGGQKFKILKSLKFSKCTSIILAVVGVAPWYFATWRASMWGC